MRSAFVIRALKNVVEADAAKLNTVIGKLRGGWEVWLQVEAAVQMVRELAAPAYVQREEHYPAPDAKLKCDFALHPAKGTAVYVELKVQNHEPDDILQRYQADILKVTKKLDKSTQHHVIVAAAYMRVFQPADLVTIGHMGGGTQSVWQLMRGRWSDTTDNPQSSPGNYYPTVATFAVAHPV